ncbi:putative LRR receptor-like serine/threonine-protein kinase [Nymphaea thermarum]|nr:putative LRR receptor-like serine/threonine-protein kinase [Nymphaea thermarum]
MVLSGDAVSALRAIKKSLVDPLGKLKNWGSGDPCKPNWNGIFCFNSTLSDGYLHVREVYHINEASYLFLCHILIFQQRDVMWNNIAGTIPKEIGSIKTLKLLLLNGNHLTGPLPEEIGFLPNLDRIQIDQNMITGPIPTSFANLNNTKHLLLDNNNLSGSLPPELYLLPSLLILQLDNNQFTGAIPASYSKMSKLLKLSLRNCSLEGLVPDLSSITELGYLDLSWNHLTGVIPTNKLSANITTISLENNQLNGSVPATIWENRTYGSKDRLIVDLQNNSLSNISSILNPPTNVSVRLQRNPLCSSANQLNVTQFCGPQPDDNVESSGGTSNSTNGCLVQSCPAPFYEYVPSSPVTCFCAAPIKVGYRLKSPGISVFPPYVSSFRIYLTSSLDLDLDELNVYSFMWEEGPRLKMYLKLFPMIKDSHSNQTFNLSEILRLRGMFTSWAMNDSPVFGPYELLNFTLEGPYEYVNTIVGSQSTGMSKGVLVAIILVAAAALVAVSSLIVVLFLRRHAKEYSKVSTKRLVSNIPIKVDGVKDFTFGEMALATNDFSNLAIVGEGGYGKVYKGSLVDGSAVAIKRAQEGSLQGQREFFTEIELLSRLHHRNLVSLIGYCNEEGEQMLVYEFMPNGSLREHLSAKAKDPPDFGMRLRIALGAARGIQYLHNEANPPIFHRDIKASNILLDSKFIAKVADFGLSKLAPVPEVEGSEPGHVSTVVKGTPGYLDPEYFLTHKLTDKSDVYSLGVVFFELLTGMHPISHGKNIVREVNHAYQAGLLLSVLDSRLGPYPFECLEQFAELAMRCCQDETEIRPSISEVVRELENIWRKMPDSVYTTSESAETEIETVGSLGSSSVATTKDVSVSFGISGGDLHSGAVPDLAPLSALRAIKKSLVDPLGKLKNWGSGDPCKPNWNGIFCFNSTSSDGYLHVREVYLHILEICFASWPLLHLLLRPLTCCNSIICRLLNGNHLTGPLPEEIGFLPNLDRIQIDQNMITGPIPTSFANLNNTKHLLLDNNNLSGSLPPDLYLLPNFQLDNNQFTGAIPASYSKMSKLLKLSLRNCSLEGLVPDLSSITGLGYLDLSWNNLTGVIPTNKLSANITTIDLSNNKLVGTIPQNFSSLPLLQRLSLKNNQLNGSVLATIWENRTKDRLIVDLQNNSLSNISSILNPPTNVLRLQGNPLCSSANQLKVTQFCGPQPDDNVESSGGTSNSANGCLVQSCPAPFYEYVPSSPVTCFCAAPIKVGYRLKSPGISVFSTYVPSFCIYLTSSLDLDLDQLYVGPFIWEEGPRLEMYLKLFPMIKDSHSNQTFNLSEILRLRGMFTSWAMRGSPVFGPYELLNFTLEGPYEYVNTIVGSQSTRMSKGILVAIILTTTAALVAVSSLIVVLFLRRHAKEYSKISRKSLVSNIPIKVDGVKDFTFGEMALATNDFSNLAIVGEGGYGKVYKGSLVDGSSVAIKRAQEGSLQGQREFFTEIELLSRLHHRNLVSLIGYCNEEGEQMLVYEFMPNGSLRQHLSAKAKDPPDFGMRLRIALGAARGIQYLHNEANPPIFHRDIKASNILLDSKFIAKVADFGLSKLAPVPEVEGSEPGHVSTVVKGTPGYLDPEYFLTHKLTDKSDVYSLGVVFFELLTGMHPISHGKNIVREVNHAYQAGLLLSVLDSRLGPYQFECLEQFAELAMRCCQDETDIRPSISEVVRELENIWRKMPDSVYTTSESAETEIETVGSLGSSSITTTKDVSVSFGISGGDFHSGAVPDLAPR